MSDQPFNSPQIVAHALPLSGLGRDAFRLLPGLALCIGATAAAYGLEAGEARLFGRAWLEALVLAILIGTAVRTAWMPGTRFRAGINFGAKQMLELAVALLGVSISFLRGEGHLLREKGVLTKFRTVRAKGSHGAGPRRGR